MTDKLGQRAVIEVREDVRGHGSVIETNSSRHRSADVCEIVQIHEMEHGIITKIWHTEPGGDSCPSQNKHFFCGMAKKLGCKFCVEK